jgi:hypothetical protein
VVAGTATAVSNRVSRRQASRWGAQDQYAYEEQPQYAPGPPAPTTDDKIEQLKALAELRTSGVLTDAEFEAQKAKILAG